MSKSMHVAAVPSVSGSRYPVPFDEPCRGRVRRRLSDAAGLTQFGVNLARLPPGCWSSQRHWHTAEDEFVYIVDGEVVLVTESGEDVLRAGDCAGFKAGTSDGHHLQNRSRRDTVRLHGSVRESGPGCSARPALGTRVAVMNAMPIPFEAKALHDFYLLYHRRLARFIRSLRRTRRAEAHAVAPEFEGGLTESPDTERRDWLAKALAKLPIEQRVTLELTYCGGYSCEEIASIMVCPVNTVKTRMFYAREKLRVVLPELASPIGTRRLTRHRADGIRPA